MRRFILALAVSLVAPAAWAQCTSAVACETLPCKWTSASSWVAGAGCTSPPTTAGEPWTIAGTDASHPAFMILDTNVAAGQGTITNGVLGTMPDTGERLTITGAAGDDITLNTGGTLRFRRGDNLRCDSTAASCQYRQNDGGLFDLQGAVTETTIIAVTDIAGDTNAPSCGGAVGRKWTVTVANPTNAVVGGRLRFLSGLARSRVFEVVGVSGNAVTVCTALTDAISISTYGSQRLTPHATIGALAVAHSLPTVTDSSSPYYKAPVVGDEVALIHDVVLDQSGGANGYRFYSPNSGVTTHPLLRAAHFNAPGTAEAGVSEWGFIPKNPASSFGVVEYVNWHDYIGNDQMMFLGWTDSAIRRNECHDAAAGATDSAGCIYPGPSKVATGNPFDGPPDRVDVIDNWFARTRGNALNFNVSTTTLPSHNNVVAGNIVDGGCTTASGECGGLEVSTCQGCLIIGNIVHDICTTTGNLGTLFSAGSTTATGSDRMVIAFNWAVNACNTAAGPAYVADAGRNVYLVGNYFSHVNGRIGLRGGKWYGNVVKNWGLRRNGGGGVGDDGIFNPESVFSTWMLGADAAVAAAVNCGDGTTPASSLPCQRHGIFFDSDSPLAAGSTATVRDVMIGAFYTSGGRAFEVDTNTDYNVSVADWSATNLGLGYFLTGARIDAAPASPITVSISDGAVERTNQATAIQCSSSANVTDTIGNMLFRRSGVSAADDVTPGPSGTCSSTGTFSVRGTLGYMDTQRADYNLPSGSFALTAGAGGGPLGVRAFRHPRTRIEGFWGPMPFDGVQPADVANGVSNADTDGDGIMDLYDNCDLTWNPDQTDGDADGKGCACDPGDTCP